VEHRLPIQPFDDALREEICKAIARPFERHYREDPITGSYDPDTIGEAADAVIALAVGKLLGVKTTIAPQAVIGNGTVVLETDRADEKLNTSWPT